MILDLSFAATTVYLCVQSNLMGYIHPLFEFCYHTYLISNGLTPFGIYGIREFEVFELQFDEMFLGLSVFVRNDRI